MEGDVVHRPREPWTPTVQSLLAHLHAEGLPVPEPLGYDDDDELVRLVDGDAGDDAWPHQLGLEGVRSAGALLRRVHEASARWRPPAGAAWSVESPSGPLICHGDPQPANFAWRDGRAIGLFDWDAARPAEPFSDVAYALLWFTPLNADAQEPRRRGLQEPPERRARADALLEGYGWSGPVDVVDAAVTRHAQAIDEVDALGAAGHEPHAGWVAAGWTRRWRGEPEAMRSTALTDVPSSAGRPSDRPADQRFSTAPRPVPPE